MNLYTATKQLWDSDSEVLVAQWATAIKVGIPQVEAASAKFRAWRPLRFYLTVGSLGNRSPRKGASVNSNVLYSIRFQGQEVAKMNVDAAPHLMVSGDHETRNRQYFGLSTPKGKWPWTGPDARAFRAEFSKTSISPNLGFGRSKEHEIESRLLTELEKRTHATKFAGTLAGVRHVGLTKRCFPFQCPVPISANTGIPTNTRGNIDILARRRGANGKVRLSVWELKRPEQFQHALDQAYIYSVTLALMLRGRAGSDWYRIFGFSSALPDWLEIESVVVVTSGQRNRAVNAANNLKNQSPLLLQQEKTTISLHAAYYDPQSLAINFMPLP